MTLRTWLALASRCGAFVALLFAVALASCRRHADETGNAAGATALEPAGPNPSSAALLSVDAGPFIAATRRACRVMALRGTATVASRVSSASTRPKGGTSDVEPPRSLRRGDLLPEGELVELGAATEMTVQATASAREITLVGPATAEVCPGGDEAVRLSRGKVTAFPGAGVRPGAEVWVATPLGVVRFNEAKLQIDVQGPEADRLEIAVVAGQGIFVPAFGVVARMLPGDRADGAGRASPSSVERDGSVGLTDTEGGAMALAPGVTIGASRAVGSSLRWTGDLVAACVRSGVAAREAGQRVTAGEGGRASRGDLAFAHVRARQNARAACEAARAAGATAPEWLDSRLRVDLDAADENWKQLTPLPARR